MTKLRLVSFAMDVKQFVEAVRDYSVNIKEEKAVARTLSGGEVVVISALLLKSLIS